MMPQENLVFAATCDFAGLVRGKAFPAVELEQKLRQGIGTTASNIMISAFGPIHATPFGTTGDILIMPDPETEVHLRFDDAADERFLLSDLRQLDGTPWMGCTRDFLRRATTALEREAGLVVKSSFEQEFVYDGVADRAGSPYSLDIYRRQGRYGAQLTAAIRAAGLIPDSFLPEFGPRQFEVTIKPRFGLRAADEAIILREMIRLTAHRAGQRAILAPILTPEGIGSGTHIHYSLWDTDGTPVTHDPAAPYGVSARAAPFVAGILHHLPSLSAITAASVASYYRLQPNRWAPTWSFLGRQDRGAAMRVAPVFPGAPDKAAAQFNLEYRVADATACPYLALGALIHAGLDGIRQKMTLPDEGRDLWAMTEAQRLGAGYRMLPRSLEAALDLLEANIAARDWFGEAFLAAYLMFKRGEIASLAGLSAAEICARYAEVY